MSGPKPTRKTLGSWYTPDELVDVVTAGVVADFVAVDDERRRSGDVRVLDPACGDGRLLEATGARLVDAGYRVELTGCDIDPQAPIDSSAIRHICGDALARDWGGEVFDIVVGNPPFLSQMATSTSRGGASRFGGGPYANAAAEFVQLALDLTDPTGSAIGLVLPQSILAARDTAAVRRRVDEHADRTWAWWRRDQSGLFDAAVHVCALGLRRPASGAEAVPWTRVITSGLGVPFIDRQHLSADGTVGDRAVLRANFRDEYYALVGAVADDVDGPPLVTSGLIDPGRNRWGERSVTFGKATFAAPRVDVTALEERFARWARRALVPKVLVANQTRVVEAVADVDGAWIPGVPVTWITPLTPDDPAVAVRAIEAVLTSPVASAWCWHHGGGTGLSATSVRMSPRGLASIPWPVGDLRPAMSALEEGRVDRCGAEVLAAFGVVGSVADGLLSWWENGMRRGR